MDKFVTREQDVDAAAVEEICRTRTKEELDTEWEEFKRRFTKEHEKTA